MASALSGAAILAGGGVRPARAADAPAAKAPGDAPRRRPNIIFILADDLGYGDLGCYGQKKVQTPCLDRMAREGMRFTDFYSGSTVCAPSRSCLMTGQHTGHTIIRGNATVPLRPQDVTVAEVLKAAGCRTALIGKWGLGEVGSTGYPTRKGFDYFYGLVNQGDCHFHYFEHVYRNQEKVVLAGNDHKKQTGQYLNDLYAKEGLAYVEQSAKAQPAQPFFLYLSYTIPHAELAVPEDSLKEYAGQFPETPNPGGHYGAQPTPRAAFAGMVSRLDRCVGRLLDKLRELGLAENTIVFFSSDNGPHKEGGADPAFFQSSGPLTGIKRNLTEGGIRVPLIAWQPGTIAAGSTCAHPSAFWDFLPTAAELAGARLPPIDPLDGISFAPSLLGRPQAAHEFLYWEFHEGGSRQAVRMGQWKAIARAFDAPLRLYDLSADIAETKDVAAEHPDVVRKITDYLKTARSESEHWKAPKSGPKKPGKADKG